MKITKNKNGTYSTRVYLGKDINGKRIQKRITVRNKSDIYSAIDEAQENAKATISNQSLRDCMLRYNASRSNILSPATIVGYNNFANKVFVNIYDMDIDLITDEILQKEFNNLAMNKSPKSLRNYCAYLKSVFKEYSARKIINIKLPSKRKPELIIPTDEQMATIYETVKGKGLELPILLASKCGLRRSEIAALSYDDFDMKNNTVSINKALVINSENKYVLKQPKSYAGYRTLDVPDNVMAIIKKRKKDNLPLLSVNSSTMSRNFARLMHELKMPGIRFHNLRHYYATMLLELGIPDKFAIEFTGHSTTSILRDVYQHVRETKLNEYRDIIKSKIN